MSNTICAARAPGRAACVMYGALVAALALLALPSLSTATTPAAKQQATRHAKALKALPTHPGEFKPASPGLVSPYARAAAERGAARALPASHPLPGRVQGTSP